MSGGRATVGARGGKDLRRQAGDISAVAPEGHVLTNVYFIECKHVKHLGLDSFLLKGTGELAAYWSKAWKEARLHHKVPLLIAKQNLLPTIVLAPPGCLPCLPPVLFTIYHSPRNWETVSDICLFDALLQTPFEPTTLTCPY